MADAPRFATYADLLEVPAHRVAELISGTLRSHPRPAGPHAAAASSLGEELGPPFKRGRGGPGGWLIIDEPEIHLGADVVVPDLAGWRRERLPKLPDAPFVSLHPDWVCEVLSPSTEKTDRTEKLPIYARESVDHAWLVNPRAKTLEVFRRQGREWLLIGTYKDADRVRAEPFAAFELDLDVLWQDAEVIETA